MIKNGHVQSVIIQPITVLLTESAELSLHSSRRLCEESFGRFSQQRFLEGLDSIEIHGLLRKPRVNQRIL